MTNYPIAGFDQQLLQKLNLGPKDAVLLRAFYEVTEDRDQPPETRAITILGPDAKRWYDVPYTAMTERMPVFWGQKPNTVRMNMNRLADRGILETKVFEGYHAKNKLFRIKDSVKKALELN
jgi:hypothetical protein